jgi:nucleoside-diphosphate-sugar epimerase
MKNTKKVLITGANGFIGRALCRALLEQGFQIRAAVRNAQQASLLMKVLPNSSALETILVGDIAHKPNWSSLLKNIDIVVHLAARVHVMQDDVIDPLAAYREMNVRVSEEIARASINADVKRFIYLSSVKVNGEQTIYYADGNLQKFTENSIPNPQDPYGISKWEAEKKLFSLGEKTGLEVVVIRTPLVYGQGVKANFESLMKWVKKGIPIPLASVKNQRSLIYIGNLVDAIIACMLHEKAAGKTYLVSDNDDVSTPDLIRRLAIALKKPVRLLPFSPRLMQTIGMILGKKAIVERLLSSLVVDTTAIKRDLGWAPPYNMQSALNKDFNTYE